MRVGGELQRIQVRLTSDAPPDLSDKDGRSQEEAWSGDDNDADPLSPFTGMLLGALIGSVLWLFGAVLLQAFVRG